MQIIRFHQESCHACHLLEEELKQVDMSKYNCTVYHTETCDPALGDKYGIRTVPTVIKLDDGGAEIGRFVGSWSAAEIEEWLALT